MPVDTSIYANRTPPDPIAGLGGTVGVANALTQNQILNAQNQQVQGGLQGQGQFGQALMDANGNPTTATNLFTQRGGNALYAPTAFQSAATLQGTQGSAANTIATGNQSQTSDALAAVNSIASNSGKRSDMLNELAARVHNGLLSKEAYHVIADNMPAGDSGAANYIKTKTQGMVTAPSQVEPVQAGVNPTTQNPILKPKAAVVAAAGQPSGTEVTAAPGVTEAAAGAQAIQQKDQLAASGIMQNTRQLEAALPLIQKLKSSDFGPGSNEYATLKGIATTMGLVGPEDTNLTGRQIANKLLNGFVQGNPHATDAGLSLDRASKPNMDLTQAADVHIIKQLVGWNRMDAAAPQIFDLEGQPGGNYAKWKSGYYQNYDPDAFNLWAATPQERGNILAGKGYTAGPGGQPVPPKPNAPAFANYQRFVHTLSMAQRTGMLPPQSSESSQ